MKSFFKKKNIYLWTIGILVFLFLLIPSIKKNIFFNLDIKNTDFSFVDSLSNLIPKIEIKKQTASTELAFINKNNLFTPFRIAIGNIRDEVFSAPKNGKLIRINIETGFIHLYENGKIIDTVSIIASNTKDEYPPGGEFKIISKNIRHYSSSKKAYLPFAMQFFSNYSIHGIPEDKNGKQINAQNKNGTIIIDTKDAEKIFNWSTTETLVSVYSNNKVDFARAGNGNVSYFIRDESKNINLDAESYLISDMETGEIILDKNSDFITPIASVTKLMTAVVARELIDEETEITISKKAVQTEGSNGNLRVGEKIPLKNLLYALILESSNDAGEAIAEYRGRDYFMEQMNRKAKDIGMENTFFDDPSGLSENNTSSAKDLLKLLIYINTNNKEIIDLTKQRSHRFGNHTWFNNNQFFAQDRYRGGKTGFTSAAGQTFASIFSVEFSEFDKRNLAIILLKTRDRSGDIENSINYLRGNIYYGKESIYAGGLVAVGDITLVPRREEVTLAFVGDMMLNRGVEASVNRNGQGDYSFIFKEDKVVNIIQNADIAFGNLEGPVSDKGKDGGSLYSFRMNPEVLPLLRNIGFDALSIANNHMADWGNLAFTDTLRRLEENEIIAVGGSYTLPEAIQPKILERNGIRVGFLGFSDVGPDWMLATETNSGILSTKNEEFYKEVISEAKKQVDVLVVSIHFGEEYQPHTDRQELLAKRAVDNGATLVVGHHAHITQDTESYRDGFIAYGLGNFIFDQGFRKETMEGLLLEVRINKKGIISHKKYKTSQNNLFQITDIEQIQD